LLQWIVKMIKHFEQLWEDAEKINAEINDGTPVTALVEELIQKLGVYRILDQNDKVPADEKIKLKSHLFGKILVLLTNLSLKDNINVYASLNNSIEDLKIDLFESKYQ